VTINVTSITLAAAAQFKVQEMLEYEALRRLKFGDQTPLSFSDHLHACPHCFRTFANIPALTTHTMYHSIYVKSVNSTTIDQNPSEIQLPKVCSYVKLLRPENNKRFKKEMAFGLRLYAFDFFVACQLKWVIRPYLGAEYTLAPPVAKDYLREHLAFIYQHLEQYIQRMGARTVDFVNKV
jgi:hypothetical protein